jgi:C1A family cysteine protease
MYSNRVRVLFATIILSVLIGSLSSAPSLLMKNLFSMQGENVQNLAINKTFFEDSKTDVVMGNTIASSVKSVIYGASINAEIKLLGEASLVRVILIDNNYNEYLVYEINSLLADNKSFSLKDACHETKLLNAVNPISLRIDLLAASIELQKVSFVTTAPCSRNEMSALQNQIKTEQHQQRIDLYNKQIKIKGEEWIAGPTEISMKTYLEKKCYFLGGENNPLPNTQGTEYYVGGVMPSRTNIADVISEKDVPRNVAYADTFDWRNRHGATKSGSPYFNSAALGNINGWATPIRNQGSCGSCWVFAGVGDAEQKYNLYYNRHIDMDLSEQMVGACVQPGSMCSGGWPYTTENFIVTKGVIDEDALPYKGSNSVKCGDSSKTPKEHAFFKKSIKALKGTEVNNFEDLKKCIIKYGSLAGGDASISHAMTIVGYQSKGTAFTIIYKNSWGGVGDKGYMYKASPYAQSSWSVFDVRTPASITSKLYNDDSIRCADFDKDGYYNWGIGLKPKTCPECPQEEDCDDNNPSLGPYIDSTGKCKPISTGIALTKLPYSGLNYNCSFDPTHRDIVIRFEVPDNTVTTVTIYSLFGTLVRTLAVNDVEKGLQKAIWNSTNESGSPVSKGIYLCKINNNNANTVTTSSFKIAVSR